jgi:hypothetical protein
VNTNRSSNSTNQDSYSSARTTHRELVYDPLQFQKRSELFVGAHNEPLGVAMCVNNPNHAALIIEG